MSAPVTRTRISVAMATYNGEKHIREQLDSIARQDLLPVELVITDDGSTDATLQIVDTFARVAPFPVRVFRNEAKLGYADNFLKAASLCEGDLIAFCDQDDVWMEQKLSVCSGFFTDAEVALAVHSAWTLLDSDVRGCRFPRFARTRVLGPGSSDPFAYPHGFAMVIRKELLYVAHVTCRPTRLLGHDQWFWFLAACTGRIATIADTLTLYRQHQGNLFGARQQATITRSARGIAQTLAYDGLADSELACSRILSTAAERNPSHADRLNASARRLEFRSRLHRIRTGVYSRESSFLRRAITFSRIFFLGGYWPDQSGTRLGIRAALKDVLFGVFGVYKLYAAVANSSRER